MAGITEVGEKSGSRNGIEQKENVATGQDVLRITHTSLAQAMLSIQIQLGSPRIG
jgi:hypothetical protein